MKCSDCGYEFEIGDNVYSDGVKESICGDCLRDIVDMLPIGELAKMLGYERTKFKGDNEEEEKKLETIQQIPGQMDIWGGSLSEEPRCPMGHQMELFQVASGSWRYGCIECATSYKAMKRRQYGWISPMKSTKARAKEAAMKRELQRPLTIAGAVNIEAPVWFEHKDNDGLLICSVSHDFKSHYRLELFGNEIPMTMDSRRYNVKWRLWASRPTDEERAAAKWEV